MSVFEDEHASEFSHVSGMNMLASGGLSVKAITILRRHISLKEKRKGEGAKRGVYIWNVAACSEIFSLMSQQCFRLSYEYSQEIGSSKSRLRPGTVKWK